MLPLELSMDDDPKRNGEAVDQLRVAGTKMEKRKRSIREKKLKQLK